MTQRLQWLDAAKGAGIFAVVTYHCLEGMLNSFPEQTELQPYTHFFRNWIMPMFFVAAGIAARRGILSGDRTAARERIFDWVYLYLLWSLIIYLVRLGSNSFTNTTMHAHEILHIAWNPVPTIWFIYALLLSYVITTLLRHANPVAVVGIAYGANVINGYFYSWGGDTILPRLLWIYVFYAIGFYCGDWIVQRVAATRLRLAWAGSFGLIGVTAALVKKDIPTPLLAPLSLLLVYGYFQLCALVTSRGGSWLTQALCHFGAISLYIYLIHFPLPAMARLALLQAGLYHHLLAIVLAIVAAAIAGHIASRLAKTGAFGWLFQRPRLARTPTKVSEV